MTWWMGSLIVVSWFSFEALDNRMTYMFHLDYVAMVFSEWCTLKDMLRNFGDHIFKPPALGWMCQCVVHKCIIYDQNYSYLN